MTFTYVESLFSPFCKNNQEYFTISSKFDNLNCTKSDRAQLNFVTDRELNWQQNSISVDATARMNTSDCKATLPGDLDESSNRDPRTN